MNLVDVYVNTCFLPLHRLSHWHFEENKRRESGARGDLQRVTHLAFEDLTKEEYELLSKSSEKEGFIRQLELTNKHNTMTLSLERGRIVDFDKYGDSSSTIDIPNLPVTMTVEWQTAFLRSLL